MGKWVDKTFELRLADGWGGCSSLIGPPNDVRRTVGSDHFVEVFVDTPFEACEARDRKGLYARARRGEITGFTGIDDPYERPEHPEIVIHTESTVPKDNAGEIVAFLSAKGLIREAHETES